MAAHDQTLRIYYRDTDATGVVFHPNYLAFAERGRVDALHSVDAPVRALTDDFGLHFLVHRARLEYLRPLRLDDDVLMRTGTGRLATASCYIKHEFYCEGRLTTRAEVDLVCVRASDGRPSRIPERWRKALLELSFH
jgi:acyl-CoA thioester hydrolase